MNQKIVRSSIFEQKDIINVLLPTFASQQTTESKIKQILGCCACKKKLTNAEFYSPMRFVLFYLKYKH